MTQTEILKEILEKENSPFTEKEYNLLKNKILTKDVGDIIFDLTIVERNSRLAKKITDELNKYNNSKKVDIDDNRKNEERKSDDGWEL